MRWQFWCRQPFRWSAERCPDLPLLPTNLSDLAGGAAGSFVNNGSTVAGGVMGNWNVANDRYKATGIFGGGLRPVP